MQEKTQFHGVVIVVIVLFPAEFLYLESFLQTFKREWTGIDRLRMDKFFQVSVRRIINELLAFDVRCFTLDFIFVPIQYSLNVGHAATHQYILKVKKNTPIRYMSD